MVVTDNLTSGKSSSCGCLQKEMQSRRKMTHGESKSRLYAIWQQMKNRCMNSHTTYYEYYGGRGISVCNDWLNSYPAFREWALSTGYNDNLTIDRINIDGDYNPSNCRWVTSVAQASNRRSNRVYTIGGETHTLTQWAELQGINPKTVFSRLYAGWDITKALNINN